MKYALAKSNGLKRAATEKQQEMETSIKNRAATFLENLENLENVVFFEKVMESHGKVMENHGWSWKSHGKIFSKIIFSFIKFILVISIVILIYLFR